MDYTETTIIDKNNDMDADKSNVTIIKKVSFGSKTTITVISIRDIIKALNKENE